MRRRACVAAVGAVLLLAPVGIAPVHAVADEPATLMSGPGSASDGMFLTYVGCEAMNAPATAPATRITRGPLAAPMGRRSFGLVPSGEGSASGPTVTFLSLGSLGAALDVHAVSGTSGRSYIWMTTPDAPPGHAWHGRGTVTVAPGGWQHVETATVSHDWSLINLSTGLRSAHQTATPTEFVAAHGDGPGQLVTGFGCDGQAFNVDAVRGNGRTWDFEAMTLATSITPSSTQLAPGDELVVAGSVTDVAGRVTGDPLVLQSRVPGDSEWTQAAPLANVGPDGSSRTTVEVTETREFRWLRPASEYADEGASEPVLVTVTG